MIELSESRIYEFEEFRLDAKSHRLFRRAEDELVPLTPKAVELLIYLVENAGRVLSKSELIDKVWDNSFVEEANLSQTIFVLRKTLGEDNKKPRFILTVPNRGYQFIATVKKIIPEDKILEESLLLDNSEQTPPDPKSKIQNLKSLWLAIPIIFLIAFGIYWFYPKSSPSTISEIKTIAVLPFEDLSEGQTEKYLGISLADALANKFGDLKKIIVRPTRSVLKYADSREDLSKIGRELQVDAVLDGHIQHIGERVRVSVQLVRTSDNATIWTGNFDDQFTNFFAVQDSISQKVVQALVVRMNEKELEKFNRHGTENAAAYQDYLRGRFYWNKRTGENLLKAITHFEKAIEKDPNFALAYAGLADSYTILAIYGAASPSESHPKARVAAEKALAIDGNLAEAYASLAFTQAFYDWNWKVAEESFKRAIELNPNYATAHQWYGEYLEVFKRFDEAHREYERALEIDPVSPMILSIIAGLYSVQGDYDKSIEKAKKILEVEPNFAWAYFWMGMAYEAKGQDAEASEMLAKTMELFGEPKECANEVREAFKKNGLKGWWTKRLEQIETRPHLKNFGGYFKALVQIRLGDKEGTLKSLEEAYTQRDYNLAFIQSQQLLEPIRQDPSYKDLLHRMGF
ncbi:MAG: winged helix-turn-helix domain-containing protein [Pyrinomonadaceae bacterium]|nr:winged helix-turn-helix domain-containing protein [Pyrinomonadaceae bacterium]